MASADRHRKWADGRKKSITRVLLALICSFASFAYSAPGETSERIWIEGVTIISPERLDRIEKGSVLIEDGRIAKVERNLRAKRPAGATVVPARGQYLIPGLIDSHVHLASVPGMQFDPNQSRQPMVQEYFRQLPRSYLYYGYTTLVDLAVISGKVLEDFRNAPLHPDLFDCGESLPFANGYPMSFAPPDLRFRLFPNFIYDPKQASRIPAEYKPEDHTPAADVARVKNSGGICAKTFFERGFAEDRNLPVMGPDVLAEIRRAATQAGLVLMIHANGFESQKFAVAGNVDVIVHGMWNWQSLDSQKELPDEIKRILDQIAEKRIGYQPTIQVLYGMMAYFDPEYLKLPAVSIVTPKALLKWFQTPEGQSFGKELNPKGEPGSAVIRQFEQGPLRRVRQVVAYLAVKDTNFLFGTDTPSAPTYGNLPGLNGYMEMKQPRKAGLSLEQIFRAATINNALEFKMDSQLGTIEPGKIANLLLVSKSPLETVEAYDTITTVFVHGKAVPRNSLIADSYK